MNGTRQPAGLLPTVPAPANAQAVFVTLRAAARDAAAFRAHLVKVMPVTRLASGCRYSHTCQDPATPNEFLLAQGRDSIEPQQAYIALRESTGDLATFGSFLAEPPTVEVFALVDA